MGVQYVHCMTHKCIMVKVGLGERKSRPKVCKEHVNSNKSEEIYQSREEIINFPKYEDM